MRKIDIEDFKNIVIIIQGNDYKGNDTNIGALTLSIEDREFMIDISQTYTTKLEDGNTSILCEFEDEIDRETFDECPFNITNEDLKSPNLNASLHIMNDIEDFVINSTTLTFNSNELIEIKINTDE